MIRNSDIFWSVVQQPTRRQHRTNEQTLTFPQRVLREPLNTTHRMKANPAKRPLSSPDNSAEGKAKIKMAGVQHSSKKTASGENEDLLASIQTMMVTQTATINANVDSKIVDLKKT